MSENVDVNFRANFESMKSSMEGILGEVKGWGSKIAGIFAGAFTGFIGWEGLKTLKEWLALGREGELVQARFAAQITATGGAAGYTAQQLEQMANAMEKHSLSSSTQIKDAESVLLRFTNVRDSQFTRALAAAGDASAAKKGGNIVEEAESLGRALDSPTQGMFRLSREGIRLTETQKSLITAFEQSGNIIGAQNIILAAFEAKWKGVDQTLADTTSSGKWGKIEHEMEDLRETIGQGLIPIFDKLLPYVKESADFFSHWAEVFKGNGSNFAEAFGAGLEWVGGLFKWLGDLAFDFAAVTVDALNTITGADSQGNWDSWFSVIKQGFGDILLVVGIVGAGLKTVAENFKESWTLSIDSVKLAWMDLKDSFTDINFGTKLKEQALLFGAQLEWEAGLAKEIWDNLSSGRSSAEVGTTYAANNPRPTIESIRRITNPGGLSAPEHVDTKEQAELREKVRRQASDLADTFVTNLNEALKTLGVDDKGNLVGQQFEKFFAAFSKLNLNPAPEGAEEPGGGGGKRPRYTNYSQGFQSQLEDFNAYYKRINTAAASEPQRAYEQTTAESTKQAAADLRESKELHKRVVVATEKLAGSLTLSNLAVFGI